MRSALYISVFSTALLLSTAGLTFAQAVPGADENIPHLMTFGKEGKTSWGDDDFSQTFFFTIPKDYKEPFFIRQIQHYALCIPQDLQTADA